MFESVSYSVAENLKERCKVEDLGATEDTAERAASHLLVARILCPHIQYYGVFNTALSLHSGTSFSSQLSTVHL